MLGTPAAAARRFNAESRSAMGSASATSASEPSKFRSLMTSMRRSADPATGTFTTRERRPGVLFTTGGRPLDRGIVCPIDEHVVYQRRISRPVTAKLVL